LLGICRQDIWYKTCVLLRESFQPLHNMIIHGQAASYACSLAKKSLLYFHPILSHRNWNGTAITSPALKANSQSLSMFQITTVGVPQYPLSKVPLVVKVPIWTGYVFPCEISWKAWVNVGRMRVLLRGFLSGVLRDRLAIPTIVVPWAGPTRDQDTTWTLTVFLKLH